METALTTPGHLAPAPVERIGGTPRVSIGGLEGTDGAARAARELAPSVPRTRAQAEDLARSRGRHRMQPGPER